MIFKIIHCFNFFKIVQKGSTVTKNLPQTEILFYVTAQI